MTTLAGPAPYWHSYEYTGAEGKAGSRTKEIRHGATNLVRTYHYPPQGGAAGSRPHAVERVETTIGTATTEET